MKMWGVDPVLPSIHDDEDDLILDPIGYELPPIIINHTYRVVAVDHYTEQPVYGGSPLVICPTREPVHIEPRFIWLNVLLIATCVACGSYLLWASL